MQQIQNVVDFKMVVLIFKTVLVQQVRNQNGVDLRLNGVKLHPVHLR